MSELVGSGVLKNYILMSVHDHADRDKMLIGKLRDLEIDTRIETS